MSCHTGTYSIWPSLLASLSWLSFGFEPLDKIFHPISLSSFWVFGTAPISIGHHLVNLSLVRVSGLHLYRSTIFLSFPCLFESFRVAPILIGHLPIISLSVWIFWDCTHIDRPFSYHFRVQFESGSHLYWSTIFLSFSMLVCVLGLHLYRLATFLSFPCLFESFRATPISIDHLFIISLSVWIFRDCTYIDRSFIHLVSSV